MPLENRNPLVGTRLVANYKKERYVCTIEAGEGGEGVAFVLEDGKRFKSPSAAASAVMNGGAANGWRFWSLDGEEPKAAAEAPAGAEPAKASRPKSTKAKKLIYRIPSQPKDGEGRSRWFCVACMKSFVQEGNDQPQVCPEGHRIDDPELTAPAGEAAEATEVQS